MKKRRIISVFSGSTAVFLCLLFLSAANSTPISESRTAVNVDWCSAGISGTGGSDNGGGSGTITLDCVTGTVEQAFLYWHGIGSSYNNPVVQINGNSVTGTSLGDSTSNCWSSAESSTAFEADVTDFVSGNGDYDITGLSAKPGYSSNGASLVMIFNDGDDSNNRNLVFYTGNDADTADS